jgi:hypothetical protein
MCCSFAVLPVTRTQFAEPLALDDGGEVPAFVARIAACALVQVAHWAIQKESMQPQ